MKHFLTVLIAALAVIALALPPTPCYTFDEFSDCPNLDCVQGATIVGECTVTYCMANDACGHSGSYSWKIHQKVRQRGYYLVGETMYPCKGSQISDNATGYCCNCDGSREPIP
ncbi:MAG: hypothetical protein AMXMBFR19_09210 [Chthonomonadaceae bacterium]|uniref:Uncharacterized protein n=1 Tax=Candidatus Nitrosymbiomonas proteolyticus TaxID=2608984 RepID=A0A809RA47_9BACT|nr:hypothetical protein NPRO_19550 [Candidatus Nitrosymbiomonas proteolyticus]